MRMPVAVAALLSIVLVSATGCGEADPEAPESNDVISVVADVGDARTNPEKLAQLFAEGSAPDKKWMEEASKYTIRVVDAEITGDTATATVDLEVNRTGEVESEQTWSCQRAGETWKITSAPLK